MSIEDRMIKSRDHQIAHLLIELDRLRAANAELAEVMRQAGDWLDDGVPEECWTEDYRRWRERLAVALATAETQANAGAGIRALAASIQVTE